LEKPESGAEIKNVPEKDWTDDFIKPDSMNAIFVKYIINEYPFERREALILLKIKDKEPALVMVSSASNLLAVEYAYQAFGVAEGTCTVSALPGL